MRDELRWGVIGWREKGGGDDGGVSPDPEGGSSIGSDDRGDTASFRFEAAGIEMGFEGVIVEVGATLPVRRSMRDMAIRSSRIQLRIDIPYGE